MCSLYIQFGLLNLVIARLVKQVHNFLKRSLFAVLRANVCSLQRCQTKGLFSGMFPNGADPMFPTNCHTCVFWEGMHFVLGYKFRKYVQADNTVGCSPNKIEITQIAFSTCKIHVSQYSCLFPQGQPREISGWRSKLKFARTRFPAIDIF